MIKVDYKKLLIKYIEHVSQCEGADFINDCNDHTKSDVKFTDGEWYKLKECEKGLVENG